MRNDSATGVGQAGPLVATRTHERGGRVGTLPRIVGIKKAGNRGRPNGLLLWPCHALHYNPPARDSNLKCAGDSDYRTRGDKRHKMIRSSGA